MPDAWNIILLLVLSVAFSGLAIWLSLRLGLATRIMDRPNDRSLHTTPTPRTGGACLVLVACGLSVIFGVGGLFDSVVIAALLAAVSFADDVRSLPIMLRLIAHLAAAIAAVYLYPIGPLWFSVAVVIYIGWLINVYNFMDGMDGFSGGMAVFGFGTFGLTAAFSGATDLMTVSLALTGAAAGFLRFNFPPARIFMGDGGAIPLGFLAAFLGYAGYRSHVWPVWFGPFVFSPFIVDASLTLLQRLLRGEKVWRAHRSHYYQRMARSGLGHRRTALRWYILMAAIAACAIYFRDKPLQQVAIMAAAWAVLYAGAMLWVEKSWRNQENSAVHRS